MRISISEPSFGGNEERYVLECLRSTQISGTGPFVERFEKAFAAFCGVNHAIACSNGTAALHLALGALGARRGRYVLVPDLTYIATAAAVTYLGAIPYPVDVDVRTWTMDPDLVRSTVHDLRHQGKQVDGIIPVHLYGVPANMSVLKDIADELGLFILEDAAQAHGAEHWGRAVGAWGDAAAFSFYGNKTMTCGEGGMVVTNSFEVAHWVRWHRGHAMSPEVRYYHPEVGFNYRLGALNAAVGLAQLEHHVVSEEVRAGIVEAYRRHTTEFRSQETLPGSTSSNWMFSVLLPPTLNRDEVAGKLAAKGVETRPVFVPVSKHPWIQAPTRTLQSHDIARQGLNLPTHANLTEGDVEEVCFHLGAVCEELVTR